MYSLLVGHQFPKFTPASKKQEQNTGHDTKRSSTPVSHLIVQFLGQEENAAVEGVCPADGLLVLEEQGGAQAPRLHLGAVAHVVLVQSPLRARRQPEVVGGQLDHLP